MQESLFQIDVALQREQHTDLNSAIVDNRVQPGAEATKELLDNIGHTSDTRNHSKTQ